MAYDIFDDNQINSDLRPYFNTVTEQTPALATIVLLNDVPPNTAESAEESIDYTHTFTSYVNFPLSDYGNITTNIESKWIPELPVLETKGVTQYYGLFNNFSLTGVTETKEQLTKVHMNFGGSWNAFFFGEKPTIYGFSGFFLDAKEYPYYQEFMMAYDNYLSGRKCVENKFQMLISYDNKIVDGYILNINTTINAQNPYIKMFNFSVLIKNENWYRHNFVKDKTGKLISGFNYMSSERARISYLNYSDSVQDYTQIQNAYQPTSQAGITVKQ